MFPFVVYGCSLGIAVWIATVAHIFAYAPHLAGCFWFGMGTFHILVASEALKKRPNLLLIDVNYSICQ